MLYFKKPMSLLMACVLLFSNCNAGRKVSIEKLKKPLNIILMIGDGMGLAQISAASFVYGGLFMETLLDMGLVKTSSSNDYITDSAAGATAYSTGVKTYNGAIGLGPDSISRITILEEAKANGKSVGLIATCSITHATPGSFFGHQLNREMHNAIAGDFYGKNIDYVAGTGKPYFDIERLLKDGYQVQTGPEVLEMNKSKKQFWFYNDSIDAPKAKERGMWLKNASMRGIEHLSQNRNGFFLMIEGSQIDWGGHDNDFNYTITELKDFDETIKSVIEFAKKDGNTLVIITADHETGGLSLNHGDLKNRTLETSFASTHHSGIMVPVFAYGPGSERFRGTMENISIHHKMKLLFGF
ncbi:MAG TPA: alkaline phosphatase [Bacteroidia bacterium]